LNEVLVRVELNNSTLFMRCYVGEGVDRLAPTNLAAEETFVPLDRFGSASFDQRKLGMERAKEEVILSACGDDAGYSQDRRSILLNPSVTEGA
jgi:hypothetical protein